MNSLNVTSVEKHMREKKKSQSIIKRKSMVPNIPKSMKSTLSKLIPEEAVNRCSAK